MSYLVLFPVILLHLILQQLHAGAHERLVITSVIFEASFAHMHYVGTDTVQKVLRVRYQDENTFVSEIIFIMFFFIITICILE